MAGWEGGVTRGEEAKRREGQRYFSVPSWKNPDPSKICFMTSPNLKLLKTTTLKEKIAPLGRLILIFGGIHPKIVRNQVS